MLRTRGAPRVRCAEELGRAAAADHEAVLQLAAPRAATSQLALRAAMKLRTERPTWAAQRTVMRAWA